MSQCTCQILHPHKQVSAFERASGQKIKESMRGAACRRWFRRCSETSACKRLGGETLNAAVCIRAASPGTFLESEQHLRHPVHPCLTVGQLATPKESCGKAPVPHKCSQNQRASGLSPSSRFRGADGIDDVLCQHHVLGRSVSASDLLEAHGPQSTHEKHSSVQTCCWLAAWGLVHTMLSPKSRSQLPQMYGKCCTKSIERKRSGLCSCRQSGWPLQSSSGTDQTKPLNVGTKYLAASTVARQSVQITLSVRACM